MSNGAKEWAFVKWAGTGGLLGSKRSGIVLREASMSARQQVVCSQCDKSEEYCQCDKYCTICKGQTNVKLCADGLYYCPDCREACDVALANNS